MKSIFPIFLFGLFMCACSNNADVEPNIDASQLSKLRIQFKFDSDQERLNNLGEPAIIPSANATQSPVFNSMSAAYIELVPSQFTQLREGAVIYESPMQPAQPNEAFQDAIIFNEAIVENENIVFLEIPLNEIPAGNYEYVRVSVTYQNADIRFNLKNLPAPLPNSLDHQKGTLAGFIGFNTYIENTTVKHQSVAVNDDKRQGFWLFEPQLDAPYQELYTQYANSDGVLTGQAPEGATTVVNPLAPFGVELPAGTCIVTGAMTNPLNITSTETEDILMTLSFSTNQSFEWIDTNNNGEWDIDVSASEIEQVVDMGLRGLQVKID